METSSPLRPSPFKCLWGKFGGDGFLISIGVHVVLGVAALTLVIGSVTINAPESGTIWFPTGNPCPASFDPNRINEHGVRPKTARTMIKISSKTVKTPSKQVEIPSKLVLSKQGRKQLPAMPPMPPLAAPASASGPVVGAASNMPSGTAAGIGVGSVGGGRNMVSFPPFGSRDTSSPSLVGVFYDFKQTRAGKFKDLGIYTYLDLVHEFIRRDWSESFVRERFNYGTGSWNNVGKGAEYLMEIAVGETPGGVFEAYLCYETENEPGKLKLFRMVDCELPPEIKDGEKFVPGLDMGGGGIFWTPIGGAPQRRER
jgi:hypothetical protein